MFLEIVTIDAKNRTSSGTISCHFFYLSCSELVFLKYVI